MPPYGGILDGLPSTASVSVRNVRGVQRPPPTGGNGGLSQPALRALNPELRTSGAHCAPLRHSEPSMTYNL